MKRVSFIIQSWSDNDAACFVGGSAKSPFRIVKHLSLLCERRYVIHFSSYRSSDPQVISCSVKWVKLFLKTLVQNFRAVGPVYKAFKESDVVQCHHPHFGISAALIKKLFFRNKLFIVKAHGTALPELRANKHAGIKGQILLLNAVVHCWFDRFVLGCADAVLCSSRFQETEMADLYRVPQHKIKTIYNGYDDAYFTPSKKRVPRGPDMPIRIGFCGRVVPKKNALYCFEICGALQKQGKNVTLMLILGDKNRIEDMKTYRAIESCVKEATYPVAIHYGLSERAIADVMSECDVGIVPSVGYESIPSVIYEFAASGALVFATREWGIREILKGSRGLSHNAEVDAARIANAHLEDDRSSLIQGVEVYSYRQLAMEYQRLYESLSSCK